MNSTHTTQLGKMLRRIAASQVALGDLLLMNGGILKLVTCLELAEDSSLVIRWDGGCTRCEANAILQVL